MCYPGTGSRLFLNVSFAVKTILLEAEALAGAGRTLLREKNLIP